MREVDVEQECVCNMIGLRCHVVIEATLWFSTARSGKHFAPYQINNYVRMCPDYLIHNAADFGLDLFNAPALPQTTKTCLAGFCTGMNPTTK